MYGSRRKKGIRDRAELVIICGSISWLHGLNPVRRHPIAVTVQVLNGSRVMATGLVTSDTSWQYHFQLPVYDNLKNKIAYRLKVESADCFYNAIDYPTEIVDNQITCSHRSVERYGDGTPTGRFLLEEKPYGRPDQRLTKVFLSGGNQIWISLGENIN